MPVQIDTQRIIDQHEAVLTALVDIITAEYDEPTVDSINALLTDRAWGYVAISPEDTLYIRLNETGQMFLETQLFRVPFITDEDLDVTFDA